jgi:hypothetical protein
MSKLGPEGKRLLDAGDRFDPPAGARARVGKALAAKLGAATLAASIAATETTAAAGAAPVAGWTALGVKAIGVLAIGGVVIGGGIEVARRSPSHATPVTMSETAVAHRESKPVGSPPSPRVTPVERERGPAPSTPVTVPALADTPAAPAVTNRVAAPAATEADPSARSPARRVQQAAIVPPEPPQDAPSHAAPSPPAPSEAVAPLTSAGPVLGGEVELLRDVQLARSSGDATRALALLGRYADEHPRGALRDVATTEQVLALCALGRNAEARALARPLFEGAAMSPLTARLRASCASKEK